MILDYVQRIFHCYKLFWTFLCHSCHESAKDAQFLLTENFLNRHCLLPPSLRERPVITDNWGDCFSSRGVVHPWNLERPAETNTDGQVRILGWVVSVDLNTVLTWQIRQRRHSYMSASLNVKGHLRRKTKSWNGIVHVKGIWKFLSNLNFAKCRWKREKERKEFLTWCNICIQHLNCARVQTIQFWIKDGASLAMVRYFL